MKKVFKFLLSLLAIIVVLLIVVYLTASIWVKSAVSTFVPQITKTSASLKEADISLLSGKVALKGLKIGNPAGFSDPTAFEFGEISVKFQPTSLLTSKIIIDEIKIDGTKITAEMAKTGNINLIVLNENVQGYLGTPAPTNQQVKKNNSQKQDKETKSVFVKDLKITNSSLNLNLAFLNNKTRVKLPNIQQKNLGGEKQSISELTARLFFLLNTQSFAEIAKTSHESVNKLLDNLAGRSKEASNLVKGLKAGMADMF